MFFKNGLVQLLETFHYATQKLILIIKSFYYYIMFLVLLKKKNLTKRIFREAIFFYGITVLPHFPFLSVNDTIKYTDECMTPK